MTIAGGSVITESDVAGIGGGSDGAAAFNVVIVGGNVSGTVGGGSACAPIYITVSGGSVNAVRTGEIPTNGSGTAVQLYTLTVKDENGSALADTAVTALTATPALGYAYGLTGVKTDGDGKLYVYLPAGKTAVSVTAGGVSYSGSVTGGAATLLPPQARWGTDDTCAAGGGTLTDAVTYANGLADGTAYIQLLSDVKIASMLEFSSGKTTILDLNGFDIDRGSTTENESSVLNVQGSLTLRDTSDSAATAPGKITGGRFMRIGGVYVAGNLVMEGGSITGNTACGGSGGGGVCVGGSFTMPNSKASVAAVFVQSESPFTDVAKTAYYCEAVLWAAGKRIARGTGASIFSPDGICTRAQAVTFLWRAMLSIVFAVSNA